MNRISIAIFSDTKEIGQSLAMLLDRLYKDAIDKIVNFNFSGFSSKSLHHFTHLIIYLPAISKNKVVHLGLSLCTIYQALVPHGKVTLICIDAETAFLPPDTNPSSHCYLRVPFCINDLEIRIIHSASNEECPCFVKPPIQLPAAKHERWHGHYNVQNIISAIQLIIGAYLCDELDKYDATNAAFSILNDLAMYQKGLTDEELLKINSCLSFLKNSPRSTRPLYLQNYVHDKRILFIDDKERFGWSDALATIFFGAKSMAKKHSQHNFTIYKEEKGVGTLLCVTDPIEGIKRIQYQKRAGNIFDLVILDLYFARGYGFQCLRRIYSLDPKIPVMIFSSSFGASTIITAFERYHADAYFCKALEEVNEHRVLTFERGLKRYYISFKEAIIQVRNKQVVEFTTKSRYKENTRINNWLRQFPDGTKKYARKLLDHIQFYDTELIRKLCKEAHRKLVEKTKGANTEEFIYIGVGNPAKSGAHILYYYRQENFPEKKKDELGNEIPIIVSLYELRDHPAFQKYLSDSDLEEFFSTRKIIFVDDFVGSGTQFNEEFEKVLKYLPFLKKDRFNDSTYYVALIVPREGESNISKKFSQFNKKICAAKTIDSEDSAFSQRIFPIEQERKEAKLLIKQISNDKKLYVKNGVSYPLGYKDQALLIVFEHNTPHNTLPILWSPTIGWISLFERK